MTRPSKVSLLMLVLLATAALLFTTSPPAKASGLTKSKSVSATTATTAQATVAVSFVEHDTSFFAQNYARTECQTSVVNARDPAAHNLITQTFYPDPERVSTAEIFTQAGLSQNSLTARYGVTKRRPPQRE